MGGAAMLGGALAEMETGEGKTLTALLPAVVGGLMGRPVHIVTVNDYLARRDAEQLCPVYNALGLSVGLVESGQQPQDRQRAYACDVTYCTNKELVFDYLRDRMALGARRARSRLLIDELLQPERGGFSRQLLLRGLHFAIVDEADSVLDRRSAHAADSVVDAGCRRQRSCALPHRARSRAASDAGQRLPRFGQRTGHPAVGTRRAPRGGACRAAVRHVGRSPRPRGIGAPGAVGAAPVPRAMFNTSSPTARCRSSTSSPDGRCPTAPGKRGMHQLIEAKEGCEVTQQRQTLARITYQRFFRRYSHLCGMTGTASEATGELRAVYGLKVVRIPTNRPLRRKSTGTRVFATAASKWTAVVEAVRAATRANRAVLIGTRSVDASEHVGALLTEAGLQPVILNARQDRHEAEIVAAAGQPGRITVATNMAGRGTDIRLQPEVREAGGLHVILTEYHESGRIDRQLFGRAGRQGDPGSYESIVSLDDELFVRFVGKGLVGVLTKALPAKKIPSAAGRAAKTYGQAQAEKTHARTRRLTLAEDNRLSDILGFGGKE